MNIIDIISVLNEKSDEAFVFYTGHNEEDFKNLSYHDFLNESFRYALWLKENSKKKDRVLLLLDNPKEFITLFFACIFSGRIAVPAPKPVYQKHFDRITNIISDCEPKLFICTDKKQFSNRSNIRIIEVSDINFEGFRNFDKSKLDPYEIAYLQYTSGSTKSPRGVKISHINLIEQCKILDAVLKASKDPCMVSWMPLFHDFGLILGGIYPILRGFTSVLIHPTHFIRDPAIWLKAISKYKATYSGAPNFAFEHCLLKANPNFLPGVNLSSIVTILNGAEPVRLKTINRFEETYGNLDLKKNVVKPCYGLAESTLVVSGHLDLNQKVNYIESFDGHRTLVSCGKPIDHQIVIADSQDLNELADKKVGEIFVRGPSTSLGYWKDDESEKTFGIEIKKKTGHFLRTGDLGFFKDQELYICGRSKDVIAIRGEKIHACDIEEIAQNSHPWLVGMSGACFCVEEGDQEKIILLQRISRQSLNADHKQLLKVAEGILRQISLHGGILLDKVVLIRKDVAKTSSGKVQRSESKKRFLNKSITGILSLGWSDLVFSQGEVLTWLLKSLALLLSVPLESISLDCDFRKMAIPDDYRKFIVDEIHKKFQITLPISLFEDYYTPKQLIDKIENSIKIRQKSQNFEFSIKPSKKTSDQKIAIIGMACRFPKANGLREFWDLMCFGKDAIGLIPKERWDRESLYSSNPLALAKMNCMKGGFLESIDGLDRLFFELSIRESVRMDPQHRLIMELGWECFNDAGYNKNRLYGSRTSVFIGISGSDYAQEQFGDHLITDAYAGLGSALTLAASRLSHFLNLRGPAIAIDTACSSALSAVHAACKSIHSGESEMALAGGVNIILSPAINMCLTKAGMLSPDGICKAFDKSANGYVRSEGAGVVLIKSLENALRDNDQIYAVIRGSASNHDGQASGISAPNGESQEAVIKQACFNAGISPKDIDYFEAHGTGTAIGDPIEANAIGKVIEGKEKPTTIGSVKTNIGHTESAAGIASLIKACLMLRYKKIPKNLHFENPNPLIDFERLKIRVPTKLENFDKKNEPLLIGVNGFGVGGTNVHVVLSEYPAQLQNKPKKEDAGIGLGFLLPFSSHSKKALGKTALQNAKELRDALHPVKYIDLLKTKTKFQDSFPFSAVAYGETKEDLCRSLESFADTGFCDQVIISNQHEVGEENLKPVFVFSGQGMQWPGMGKYCYDRSPVFRDMIIKIDKLCLEKLPFSLLSSIAHGELDNNLMMRTDYAQPIIFALQVGLAFMWQSYGIIPTAVVGHSMGEVASAHVAGIISLKDAVSIIIERSLLMQMTCGQGLMANIEMESLKLEELLRKDYPNVDIAAINSPTSTVVSGAVNEMRRLVKDLKDQQVSVIVMPGNYAFHSRLMIPYKEKLLKKIEHIEAKKGQVPFFSTVTGQLHEQILDSDYWVQNLCCPVLFYQAIESLINARHNFFLEIGPHATLMPMMVRIKDKMSKPKITMISSLQKGPKADLQPIRALSQFLSQGGKLSDDVLADGRLAQMLLPFVFDRQRYWLDVADRYQEKRLLERPLLNKRLAGPVPIWETIIETHHPHHMEGVLGNRIDSFITNGLLIEMVIEALCEAFPEALAFRLINILFKRSLEIPKKDHPRLRIVIKSQKISIFSLVDIKSETWVENLEVIFSIEHRASATDLGHVRLSEHKKGYELNADQIYGQLSEINYEVGQSLRVINSMFINQDSILIPAPSNLGNYNYCLNPLVYEAIEQGFIKLLNKENLKLLGFDQIDFLTNIEQKDSVWILIVQKKQSYNAYLLNSLGKVLLAAADAKFQSLLHNKEQGIPKDISAWVFDDSWTLFSMPLSKSESLDTLLIFTKNSDDRAKIKDKLKSLKAKRIFMVSFGPYQHNDNIFRIDPTKQEDYDRLFEKISAQGICDLLVLHLGSTCDHDDALLNQEYSSASILRILQAHKKVADVVLKGLFFVTKGLHIVKNRSSKLQDIHHSTIWGMLRTLEIELPEIAFWRIDIDIDDQTNDISKLLALITSQPKEREFCIREDQIFTYHMVKSTKNLASFVPPLRPNLNQVEVVLDKVYSIIEGQNPGLGSGFITALGCNVDKEKLKPGMRVIFLYSKNENGHFLIDAKDCFPIPIDMPLDAIGNVFKILQLLKFDQKVKPKDRLLFVDFYDFDLVIAKAYCKLANIKECHFVESKISFNEHVKDINNDIEEKSIDIAISFKSLDLNRFVKYFSDDAKIIHFDPSNNKLTKPIPKICYRYVSPTCLLERLSESFKEIAGLTIKILSNFKKTLPSAQIKSMDPRPYIYDQSGVYIISGGTGGLGLELAKRMAQNGAGNLVLLSRNGHSAQIEPDIQIIKNFGASISVLSLDITDKQQVHNLINSLLAEKKSIKGIVHAAGTLSNGLIQKLTPTEFIEPMRAKIIGALNLHEASNGLDLDFFLLFSSLSSQIGSRGQANYACGNAFLDALACHRVNNGLPGLSISWGPWSEKGMAALELNQSRLSKVGIGFVDLIRGLDLLESALFRKEQGHFSVLPMDWARYAEVFLEAQKQSFLEKIIPLPPKKLKNKSSSFSIDSLSRLKTREDRIDILIDMIKMAVSRCLKIDEVLKPDTEIAALGIDSIVSLELKSRIDGAIGMPIDTALLLKGPAIWVLAEHCYEKLENKLQSKNIVGGQQWEC